MHSFTTDTKKAIGSRSSAHARQQNLKIKRKSLEKKTKYKENK